MYAPTRWSAVSGGINNGGTGNNAVVRTDNNDRINNSGINNADVNANVGNNNGGVDKSSADKIGAGVNTVNAGINKPGGGNYRPSINKPSGANGKPSAKGINAKRAKFEEDVKETPILQTIMNVFDGELLG